MVATNLKKNKLSVTLVLTFLLFIIDRLTKYFSFKLPEEGVFVSSILGFKFYLNQGIAFSLPLAQIFIIIISSLIIVSLIFFLIKNFKLKNLYFEPIVIIIIGAVSNLIDRFKFNGVVDFIDIWFLPAFNLADLYIVIGIIWLIFISNKNLPKKSI